MKITIYVFLVLLFSYACNFSDKEISTDTHHLMLADTAYLPIDSLTSLGDNDVQYKEIEGRQLLFLLNRKINAVQLHDWQSKQLIKKIPLENEGPNGVGVPVYIFVQSLDSIFLISSYHYRMSLIDTTGKIIRKYPLINPEVKFDQVTMAPPQGGEAGLPQGGTKDLFIVNNEIYMSCIPSISPFIKDLYEKGKLGLKVNITTGKLTYFMPYPQVYRDKMFFPIAFVSHFGSAYNEHKNTVTYSFPCDAKIYEMSLSTQAITSHLSENQYFKEIEVFSTKPNINDNDGKEFEFEISHAHFERMRYDRYNRVYYRYILIPNKDKKEKNDRHAHVRVVIIILDEDFKQLGELMLPEHIGAGNYFINDNGFYVHGFSRNEDELAFLHYKLVKK